MDVVKATEVREKAAVEECRGLRDQMASVREQVERERTSLQSEVNIQCSKVHILVHAVFSPLDTYGEGMVL